MFDFYSYYSPTFTSAVIHEHKITILTRMKQTSPVRLIHSRFLIFSSSKNMNEYEYAPSAQAPLHDHQHHQHI